MNARIANFQFLWDQVVRLPIPPPAQLVRCDNRHHLLSDADLERWLNSTSLAERAGIIRENDERLEAAQRRRETGIYTQEELDNIARWNPLVNNGEEAAAPAPLTAPLVLAENNFAWAAVNPLDYDDPDADEIYDMEFAGY